MKKYLLDLIPKFKRLDKRLDDVTALVNKHWIDYQEDTAIKVVWIFTQDPDILRISENGVIKKGAWAYLGNGKVELEVDGVSLLFHHEFHDDHLLAIVQDGTNNFKLLVSETFYSSRLEDAAKIVDYVDEVLRFETSIVRDNTDEIKIGLDDSFDSTNFPLLRQNLSKLRARLDGFPEFDRTEMVIYFLNNHSLKSSWRLTNPVFFDAISTGDLDLKYFDLILNACGANNRFKYALLSFIQSELVDG